MNLNYVIICYFYSLLLGHMYLNNFSFENWYFCYDVQKFRICRSFFTSIIEFDRFCYIVIGFLNNPWCNFWLDGPSHEWTFDIDDPRFKKERVVYLQYSKQLNAPHHGGRSNSLAIKINHACLMTISSFCTYFLAEDWALFNGPLPCPFHSHSNSFWFWHCICHFLTFLKLTWMLKWIHPTAL